MSGTKGVLGLIFLVIFIIFSLIMMILILVALMIELVVCCTLTGVAGLTVTSGYMWYLNELPSVNNSFGCKHLQLAYMVGHILLPYSGR